MENEIETCAKCGIQSNTVSLGVCIQCNYGATVPSENEINEMLAQAPEYFYCDCCDCVIDQANYPDFKRSNDYIFCYPCEAKLTGHEVWLCMDCSEHITGNANAFTASAILPGTTCASCKCGGNE